MIFVKDINDISKIDLDQDVMFMIRSLNLSSEKLFILIRNLGLHAKHVKLDFSEYDNQQDVLESWIVDYMNSDIKVDLKTLDEELSKRILDYLKFWKFEDFFICYDGNYPQFVDQNFKMLGDLCCFLSSSVYYSVSLVTNNSIPFKFEHTRVSGTFKQNAINLFAFINMFEVELMLKKYEKFNYFMFQEKEYAESFCKLAKTSRYALFLYGQSTPSWKLFQQLLSCC